jgi:hypothetical protein
MHVVADKLGPDAPEVAVGNAAAEEASDDSECKKPHAID